MIKSMFGVGFNILKANLLKKRQPIFLSLFITNRCNLRCSYCFVVDEHLAPEIKYAEYSKEEIFDIVDEFYGMGMRMIYMLGGEPLVHKDIGEIIEYIVQKNIYLHVITNGVLIKEKFDAIKQAHAICVSLDGIGDVNDALRGKGSFDKVAEGIEYAVTRGNKVRIHAVLTRENLSAIENLATFAQNMKSTLTISPPNFLGETDMEAIRITREEYKEFWGKYLEMTQNGYPIGNSLHAIRQCRDWPIDYHAFIQEGERFESYTPTFCMNGYTYVALGAEGTMYNCINLGCLNGPNIHEFGIKGAWEKLLEWRPHCYSCSSINCIETALMLKLQFGAFVKGVTFHLKK